MFFASIVLIGAAVMKDTEETEVADENDLSFTWSRTYSLTITSDQVTDDLRLEITSKNGDIIKIKVKVVDPGGTVIFEREKDTPISYVVDVSSDSSDHFDIILEFREDEYTMSDVNVRVTGDEISDESAMMCCLGGILPFLGVVLIIVSIILLILGYRKGRRERQRQEIIVPGQREYHYNPTVPGQDLSSRRKNREPVQRDRNPYYRGSRIPGTVEAPPGYGERRRDL
jgi:hypothetical protein